MKAGSTASQGSAADELRLASWVYGQDASLSGQWSPTSAMQPAGPDGVVVDPGQPVGPVEEIGPPPVQGDLGHVGGMWSCWNACCDSGVILGAESTYLAPLGEAFQTVVLTDLVDNSVFRGQSESSLGYGIRAWGGLQRDGWGFRATYWYFQNENVNARPVVPIGGQPAFLETFLLHAYTIDLELTQRLCFGLWRIDTSFGGRYARLERNSSVLGYGTLGNGVNLTGLAVGAHEIEGPGFTFSIGGRRPFLRWPGWYGYWNYRGSLLWADGAASALTEATAVTKTPVAVATSRDSAYATDHFSESPYISQLQVGFEREKCLQCMPALFIFRAGMEYQHWNTGDTFAGSNSFALLAGGFPAFGGRVDAVANAHDGDLDLLGFFIHTGLVY